MPATLRHPALTAPRIPAPPVAALSRRAGRLRRYPGGGRKQAAVGWLLLLLVLLGSGAATTAHAQTGPPKCSEDEKFANTWYFGYKAGLDFNAATDSILPTVLTNGAMDAPAGAGVMSDGNGKILFYSNGETVWNGDGSIMETGLNGSRFTTDGPLPIRMPGSPPPSTPTAQTRYLLFTQDAKGGAKGLSYSEIVIPAGGGAGTVVAATKNTPLTQGTAEKMTAVFHKNGCDIWLIVHGWGNATSGNANRGDAFLAYRVRPATGMSMGPPNIDPPIISAVGKLHAPSVAAQGYRGQMKITPDGQQLAVARYSEIAGDSSSTVELFSFDTETGTVSNPKVIDAQQGGYYGVEFSAGRSRLYSTVLGAAPRLPQLLQFDISNIGSGSGPVGREVIPLKQTTPVNLGSMQTAPDGKIYVARENQSALGFISYPDSLGAAIAYADDSLQLSGRLSGLGLVNFNQSSLLRVGFGGESTACLEFTFTSPPIDFDNTAYAWDFGDGTTSTEKDPKHTYAAPGDYTVKLRITTNCFCRESQSLVRVPGAPTPGTIAKDQAICAGDTAGVLISSVPAGEGTGQYTYQWQQSADNSTWADIAGATAETYAPGSVSVTTYFRRLVTSGFCAPRTPTASVKITVTPKVVPGTIAADQTLCEGSTPAPLTSATAPTGGTGQFAYQWESSLDNVAWTPLPGATPATYAPGPLTATTSFRRRVTSGTCAPVLSNVVTITVTPKVAAGTIAADQAICAGVAPAPLTSETPATGGAGTVAYQWESSADNATWTTVAGATGPTYAPAALAATTYFRRQASSGACASVPSNVVTITVAPALLAGAIAADQSVCAGSPVAPLTNSAAPMGGTGQFVYQWESSPNNTTWTPIAGATTAEYAPGPLTTTTYFRRQVSSGACASAPSNVVTITITPTVTPGTIAANQTLCAGTTPALLTSSVAAAGGTGTIAYQWESSVDNATWAVVAGATGPTYAPGPLAATTYFRRRATSGPCGPVVSNVLTLTVTPALLAGTIGTDQTLCPDATPTPLTSTTGASGGTGTFAYQWESSADGTNWTAVTGATGATFAPGPLTTTTYFRRQVSSGPCASVPSNAVKLTVLPTLTAGSIAADQDVCAGTAPAPLTSAGAASGGTGTFAYQWESSADNATWTAIGGATGANYAPGPLTATTYFRRRVSSGSGTCSTGISNVVTVRIQPQVTPTVTLATPPTLCPGTPLTFTAVVNDAGPAPTFRWFVNNIPVASGPTFISSTLVTGDQVRVEVTAGPGLCSTGPATATVTVTRTPTPAPTLTIAVQPGAPVCAGEPLTFSATNVTNAGPNPVYQWLLNGNPVAGATGPVFTSSTLRDGQTVTLRLSTTNSCGQALTAVSNGVAVRIQPPVKISAGPDKEIILGTSVVLEGTADGTYPVTWTPATGLDFSGNNPLRPTASPKVTTTYRLSAGEGGCAAFDEVTVTVREAIRIPNAFTPNGDGRDDTWQIEFIEDFPNNTVTVFNRWGTQVFSAQNYSRANEWRGDINGKPAPAGTYYYVVVTKGPLGKSYSGSLTVLY
ncbi:T9SS type B sorting domain-containing protein [Hymenobacter actinosclerus]|uniref:Gliding motility-associated C-terminal domain-containing protein n=1 Tax=Hymenobacter actinosclerus TaxID=82805 RepID=A0A1I0E4C5_9BACT|nr:gliding motility-associated C-terminal domain-containing protein [Hymenobacter actinosclerus]SET39197.1 gliding motility-associated C-terminal domain-containing protein [Hymenobacter actinosclerus]